MSRPNIVLIVLDTARADYIQKGISEGWLPTLKKISENGGMGNRAFANSCWTLPSHASLFTGMYPSEHQTDAGSELFDPPTNILAEQLSDQGYNTAGISANPWICSDFGFDKGFGLFSNSWDYSWDSVDLSFTMEIDSRAGQVSELLKRLEMSELPLAIRDVLYSRFFADRVDNGAKRATDRALNYIKKYSDKGNYFLFMNYIEPHLEYNPPSDYLKVFVDEEDREQVSKTNQDPWEYLVGNCDMTEDDFEILESLYMGELAYLDSVLSKLYARIKPSLDSGDTRLLIVGDHGENIGHHDLMDHQYCLYNSLLNVPLLHEGFDDDLPLGVTELRDVYPTLLHEASVALPQKPEISKTTIFEKRDYAVSEYLVPQPSKEEIQSKCKNSRMSLQSLFQPRRAIQSTKYKLIQNLNSENELYPVDNCIHEERLSTIDNSELEQKLKETLEEAVGPFVETRRENSKRDVSQGLDSRLEDLGYL